MVTYYHNARIMVKNHQIIHSHNGHYGKKCCKGQFSWPLYLVVPTYWTFFTVMVITGVNNLWDFIFSGRLEDVYTCQNISSKLQPVYNKIEKLQN